MFGRVLNEKKYSRVDQVNFLKAVFHKFYLVHSWIFRLKYASGSHGHLFDALWHFFFGILLEVRKCIYLMIMGKDC